MTRPARLVMPACDAPGYRKPVKRKTVAPQCYERRKPADVVVLRLAVPPSSNDVHSLRKGGGIRLSDAYARWLCEAGWRLSEQRPGRIVGGYVISLHMPASSGMDQDNCIAGISDLLQMHGVIRNDCEAEETHLYWHGGSNDLLVELRPYAGPPRHAREVAA